MPLPPPSPKPLPPLPSVWPAHRSPSFRPSHLPASALMVQQHWPETCLTQCLLACMCFDRLKRGEAAGALSSMFLFSNAARRNPEAPKTS
eukprot:11823297-Alexandrium_andersonii.AAC.1